ncbi:MAG: hypothetical protein P0Y55_10695 [Candidatus Cohnella colombiensis]|uniref:Uncharacterized protein n=1 Tax=Candidatus Cohnella colombiensis TaxID=3121368 RepID=A0AA95JEB3_9BACL|nr:MAG: hypothetical protein P0Y55_10695 [Cohnella sp.]
MEEVKKRTYTVPVLLIILFGLSIFFVLVYSKLLLLQQENKTEFGMELATKYNDTVVYADQLQKGAELLLNAQTEVERLQSKVLLGEAQFASREVKLLLIEVEMRSGNRPRAEVEEAVNALISEINGENSRMFGIGEHDGELTAHELETLVIVRDGADKVAQALSLFRAPSGEAGYRQMVSSDKWLDVTLEAKNQLEQLAAQLKQ